MTEPAVDEERRVAERRQTPPDLARVAAALEDVSAGLQQLDRRGRWIVWLVVAVLAVGLLNGANLIQNRVTSNQTAATTDEIHDTAEIIRDCTSPEGACNKASAARTAAAVGAINTETAAQIKKAVDALAVELRTNRRVTCLDIFARDEQRARQVVECEEFVP